MNALRADADVSERMDVIVQALKASGQWAQPTPRLAAPRLSGWIFGYISKCLESFPEGATRDTEIQHAFCQIFLEVPNPFGDMGGNVGLTMAVEGQRLLALDGADAMSAYFMEGFHGGQEAAGMADEAAIASFLLVAS